MKLRDRNRVKLDALALEKGCTDCGYKKDVRALEWDHLQSTKFKKNAYLTMSWETIKQDFLPFVEVVCSNCHSIRTHERGQYNKGKRD